MFSSFFKRFFTKKPIPFNIEEFIIGQMVELEYHDPKTIGIIVPNSTTFTRLNPDEMDNRVIRGTIERINWNDSLACNVVTIKTFKMVNKVSVVRTYLFLEAEIKTCRGLE